MNPFRFAITALSLALIFSIGSSLSAATDYSHPQFTVAEDRTLNLRETGSKIVMETIEDALRQGGLALLGEGFQIDSSLGWVFGEAIEGEIDVVVPLWSEAGHVVFAQPGLVSWTGIADEGRIDTNLGVVYRTSLLNTPIGIDAIGGASIFYDNNFGRGHSRISLGVDAQHKEFHGGLNYYQPLSDDKPGRTDYIEDAIRGMDARLAYEKRGIRVGGNLGYWRYEGDGTGKSEWELSYGLDASVQIVEGVFIEGGYEQHDEDASIGDRLNLGVAFRFSLPDFKGGSYADGSMSSDLYRIVEREKRILYEEREANTPVQLRPVDENREPLTQPSTIAEGNTVTIAGELVALPVAAMLELVIDEEASSADLGDDFNYGYKVYELNEGAGEQSEPSDTTACSAATCTMTVPAGVTRFDVEIALLDDGVAKEIPEEIVLRVNVPAEHQNVLRSGETTVTIQAHGNTVAFASDAPATLVENDETTGIEVSVSVDLPSPVPITLNVETGGTATAGTDYRISGTSLTIPANASSASLTLRGIDNDRGEGSKTIILTLSDPNDNLPEGWAISNDEHTVTLQDDDRAIFFTAGTQLTVDEPGAGANDDTRMITVGITEAPSADIVVTVVTGTVQSGQTAAVLDTDFTFNSPTLTFNAENLTQDFPITITGDRDPDLDEFIVLMLEDMGTQAAREADGFSLGSPLTIRIPANDNTVGFATDAVATLDESGGTASVEVSVDLPAPADITLNVSATEDSTATEGTDYRNLPASMTISAGQTTGTITLTGIEDQVVEEDETIVLMLSAGSVPTGWALGTAVMHTVTISDDPPPNISFSSGATGGIDGGMAGSSTTSINLVITPASTSDITIPLTFTGDHVPISDAVTVSGGTATLTGKPSTNNVMINVPANLGTVTLAVVSGEDCDRDADDVSFSLGTLPAGYVTGSHSSWKIRIHDGGVANC